MDESTRRVLNTLSIATGRTHDPEAPENQNEDFKVGYETGLRNEDFDLVADDHPITVEWKRRGGPFVTEASFNAWKRGYWAGRLTAITNAPTAQE